MSVSETLSASGAVFPAWDANHSKVWGAAPLRIAHSLHRNELFSDAALARLLETYPREHYSVVQWGSLSEKEAFREGELNGLDGISVLQAVAKARVWINLRNVAKVDARYAALLAAIAAETKRNVPGLQARGWTMGILISSPGSRTIYHADLPGQALLQVRGEKTLVVYPRAEPFICSEHLERIALSGVEASLPYQAWYDDYAQQYPMRPGDMMHWPLNAPHRVDNGDSVNISVTVEYTTPEIRRKHMVNLANAILRSKLGVTPGSNATSGFAFWSKRLLQRALRNTSWVKREDRSRRAPQFRLDPARADGIAEINPAGSAA